jgi:RNA polymerase sigma-70 factor (ECF subfamily)
MMAGIETHDGERIVSSLATPGDFGCIFERHFDAIHRYVARRLGIGAADDLAATVFAEAFANRASFLPDVDNARPWLYGITTNLIRRHRRRERAAWRAYARHGVDPFGIDEHPRLDEVAVARALGRISKGDRDALLLMVWADLAYDDIATALDIPVGTVRSRINRARARLRVELENLR